MYIYICHRNSSCNPVREFSSSRVSSLLYLLLEDQEYTKKTFAIKRNIVPLFFSVSTFAKMTVCKTKLVLLALRAFRFSKRVSQY